MGKFCKDIWFSQSIHYFIYSILEIIVSLTLYGFCVVLYLVFLIKTFTFYNGLLYISNHAQIFKIPV